MSTEDEAVYTAALKELAAVIAKLDRARRRCADLEAQMDAHITYVENLRQHRAEKAVRAQPDEASGA